MTMPTSFPDKDFRQVVTNLSSSLEQFEPGDYHTTAQWTKAAAKELQQARSDWKGKLVTSFYDTSWGNNLRTFANFLNEIVHCVTELRTFSDKNVWNKPNPQYFKINLGDGHPAYFQREAAFRLGYRHVLATVPLHRVNGKIELDPKKISNPLQLRRLELLVKMLTPKIQRQFYQMGVVGKSAEKLFQNEMEKLLDDYDFINPNKESDLGKYLEFTAFIDQNSKDRPLEELSNQTREVIDIAGRIDALGRSKMNLNRRTFIALMTGAEMLPEKVVPGAKALNDRAAKAVRSHMRLATSAYIRSLLQKVEPKALTEIHEILRNILVSERLYGLKRSAFINRLQQTMHRRSEPDEKMYPGYAANMRVVTDLLGLKKHESLDPASTFELFLQLGFLKQDPKVLEQRREISRFIDEYIASKEKDPVTLERILTFCNDTAILRVSTLEKLSKILNDNINQLKNKLYELSAKQLIRPTDKGELQLVKNRMRNCSLALDKVNEEFKIRGSVEPMQLSPVGEWSEQYSTYQAKLLPLFYALQNRGIRALKEHDQDRLNTVPGLIKEATGCIHTVKKRIQEAASDVDRKHFENQLHALKAQLWALNLLKPDAVDRMCDLEEIEKNKFIGGGSPNTYYEIQIEIFKNAPTGITKAPIGNQTVLERVWNILDSDPQYLPVIVRKFVETLNADEPFIKRMNNLAVKKPDAFYRSTDFRDIDRMRESVSPLRDKAQSLLVAQGFSNRENGSLREDTSFLQDLVVTLDAATQVMLKHTPIGAKKAAEQADKIAKELEHIRKELPANNMPQRQTVKRAEIHGDRVTKANLAEAVKRVQEAQNKYYTAWLDLQSEYVKAGNNPQNQQQAFAAMVKSPKFLELIESGEEWKNCVNDVLSGMNRAEMPQAYDQLSNALQSLTAQLSTLYGKNTDALQDLIKFKPH